MTEQDRETWARFERRFAGIEAELIDAPPSEFGRRTRRGVVGGLRALGAAVAVIAIVVAAMAIGPRLDGDRSAGPPQVVGTPSPSPIATTAGVSAVPTVPIAQPSTHATVCYTSAHYTRPEPDPAELDARIRDAGGTDRPVRNGYAGSAEGLADYRNADQLETSNEGRTADLVIHNERGERREQWSSNVSERGETVWMLYEIDQQFPCPDGA